MLPQAIAALSPRDLCLAGFRRYHYRILRRYYRTQLERIQTLKLHVARMPGPSKEACESLLYKARMEGALGVRGIQQAQVFYDAGRPQVAATLIERRLEQIVSAEKGLTEMFNMIKMCNDLDSSRFYYESKPDR